MCFSAAGLRVVGPCQLSVRKWKPRRHDAMTSHTMSGCGALPIHSGITLATE
jgi:hypothetical protein